MKNPRVSSVLKSECKKMKKILLITLIIVLAAIGVGYLVSTNVVDASIQDGEAYNYTRVTNLNASTSPQIIKAGNGTLGSIVVSSTTVGTLNVYDGTKMDVKTLLGASTGQTYATTTATSTMALMGASIAAGTYTFDVAFTNNLVIMPSVDFYGSYTITWR